MDGEGFKELGLSQWGRERDEMFDIGLLIRTGIGWVGGVFVLGGSLWIIFEILKGMNRSLGFEETPVASWVVIMVFVIMTIVSVLEHIGN